MPTTQKKQAKRGLPKRTGKRKSKRAAYYESIYPYRKLLHLLKAGATIAMMRAWADSYKTPIGGSGNAALVRLAKKYDLNVNQVSG